MLVGSRIDSLVAKYSWFSSWTISNHMLLHFCLRHDITAELTSGHSGTLATFVDSDLSVTIQIATEAALSDFGAPLQMEIVVVSR